MTIKELFIYLVFLAIFLTGGICAISVITSAFDKALAGLLLAGVL